MTTQSVQQQAVFPDLPRNQPLVDKDGNMNQYWILFFQNLVAALQNNFSNEGIKVPAQTATNILSLTTSLTSETKRGSIANVLYDSTNNAFKGNVNGTWKTFTLT